MEIIKRYLSVLGVFARNSLLTNLEYRANFFAGMFVEVGFMVAKLTYVFLIYETNITINGMTPDYMLIFIGTYVFMTGIYMSFYGNFLNISNQIKTGNLDILITKPVSLLFILSFQNIDFAMPIPCLISGTIMIGIGWVNCGIVVNLLNISLFIIFLILGSILTYALFLLPRLLSFWIISTNGISQICDSLWDFNNMPKGIYGRLIQNIGTFIIPIFLITNLPGMIIKEKSIFFMAIGVIAPAIFLWITLKVWKIGIRNYTSASS
ncbi:MAG: ABC transporter permease [Clostridium sp.]|uniref:ABC transporter permease n=1 Tax=Clostridium sp. TaxID=1506 RepID=UPI003EE62E90